MRRLKHKGLLGYIESYYFGRLIYAAAISAIVVWSVILIATPEPIKHQHPSVISKYVAESYQLTPEPASTNENIVQPTPVQNNQPAPQAWQGPIEPIPEKPSQPSVPIYSTISTTEPVVFLTIDDGWVQTPEESIWLTEHHLPFTLFLTDNGIKNNYKFFQLLQSSGMSIEDHTISHTDLTTLTLQQQKEEICGAADIYANVFGRRPTKLRPPYGKANADTLQAAADCGMKQIIMWRAVVQNGAIQYQDDNNHLKPGDIVLMHFSDNFVEDIQAFMKQTDADHLQIANLEDWLP